MENAENTKVEETSHAEETPQEKTPASNEYLRNMVMDETQVSGMKTMPTTEVFNDDEKLLATEYTKLEDNNLIFAAKRSGYIIRIVINKEIKNLYPQAYVENFLKAVDLLNVGSIKFYWAQDKPLIVIAGSEQRNCLLFAVAPRMEDKDD